MEGPVGELAPWRIGKWPRRFGAKIAFAAVAPALLLAGCTCGGSTGERADAEAGTEILEDVPIDAGDDLPMEPGDTAETDDVAAETADGDALEEYGPPPDINCGNGRLDLGEECDDGNRLNGDECDWLCRTGPGEDPPELWPDPTIVPAVPETPPTEVDLGVENPDYLTWGGLGNRPPLVSDGESYATVWPHRASDEEDSPIEGTFVRFDTSGRRRDAPWTYRLAASYFRYMSASLLDLAWSGSGYGLLWAGREVVPPGEGPGISFMALDVDGKPVAGPVSLSANGEEQQRLGIAWDGDGYGCLGEMFDGEDGFGSLGLLRVTPMGERRDPRRHVLAGYPGWGQGGLAASGRLFVAGWVGWPGSTGPAMAMYGVASGDGNWYGAGALGPVVEGTGGVVPDVAWSGSEFGIAWFGPGVVEGIQGVWFARLSARGELLAPARRVFYPVRWCSEISMTFGHGTYAVGFLADGDRAHLLRLDRSGTFVEHVVSDPLPDTAGGPAAVAADDLGFGVLGATYAPDAGAGFGPPVFTWFRVVSP